MQLLHGLRRVALAASLVFGATLASAQSAKVGDMPSYQFRQPITNGAGVKSLADLLGEPVFIEYWGTR